MQASRGFLPIAAADARVLVLGSLPGQASLAQQQYYAQPRNVFWKIIGDLFGFDPALDYPARQRVLQARRIALWDVCAAAQRRGSLDSAIRGESIVCNAFGPFLATHSGIRLLCFNGARAAELFERRVVSTLALEWQSVPRLRLPSTSPAFAGMRYARKLEAWRAALQPSALR